MAKRMKLALCSFFNFYLLSVQKNTKKEKREKKEKGCPFVILELSLFKAISDQRCIYATGTKCVHLSAGSKWVKDRRTQL